MLFLYNVGVQLYVFVVRLLSFNNEKALKWWSGRKEAKLTLSNWQPSKPKTIWVHAASLGEFEMGKPIFEPVIQKLGPENVHLVITFFSPSGYDVAKERYKKADLITYLPIDTAKNARFFLQQIQPDLAVFIKYEFWHYIIKETFARDIPIFTVGARFHRGQVFFKWYGKWFLPLLKGMNTIFVQREQDLDLGLELGLENLQLGGDPRFYKALENADTKAVFPLVEKFSQNRVTLIAGSCWEPEEEIMLKFMNKHLTEYSYIIAPHEFKESRLEQFESIEGLKSVRYSQLNLTNIDEFDVLIIDKVGDLAQLYRYGDFAFVGGGFGVGLHNILEPLAFGIPTVFGPDDRGFREAQEVIDLGAASKITSTEELEASLKKLNKDDAAIQKSLRKYFSQKTNGIDTMREAFLNVLT